MIEGNTNPEEEKLYKLNKILAEKQKNGNFIISEK